MFAPRPDQWQALSPYLDEALAMTDEERSTWLASLRTQSPELAAQLEKLSREHRALSEEGFLETSAVGLPGRLGLAGQTLGVYRLISQIGQGGMGSVWLAERNDGRFERRVAVKFLNLGLIGKGGEDRFKREGQILALLVHPHIAELVDAGVSQGGQPYLVLEHIEGDRIDHYCDRHTLVVEARIRLFLDVLQAVAHAHDNLIVHRDLKPSNVLVRKDEQVKLLDFGIAKLLEGDGLAGERTLTAEGGRAMTPECAAPEQLLGGAITTATDVYALGVLLYVLLTGQHPAGPGAHTAADLVKAIVETEPMRPSDVVRATRAGSKIAVENAALRGTTPERLSRMLRGDLDTIVAKALKKNPRERYASVRAFADDLNRHIGHEPISARPDTIAYRAGKFMRRHRRSVTAVLLATLALIGATITTWLFSRRSAPLPELKQRRLTANAPDLRVLNAAISPDGKYLGYGDREGIHLQFVETGGTQSVPLPPGIQPGTAYWVFGSWYPDSMRFVASVAIPGKPVSLWSIPVQGGMPQKLAEVEEMSGGGKVSPDGSNIAYLRLRRTYGGREIWLMGSHGESPHKILTAENQSTFRAIAWSPTGNRIAYSYASQQGDHFEVSVQSCDLDGANKTTILQDNKLSAFTWIPSGRFIYSRRGDATTTEADNLWELSVDDKSGTPQGRVRRLTDWSGFSVYSINATADGKHLAFLRGTDHDFVYVGDLISNGRRLVNSRRLTIDDNLNIPLAWTPDSREIIFSSQRAATRLIYATAIDQSSSPQLITTTPDMNFYMARLTPDGAWMILEGEPKGVREMALYRVGIKGGVPELLFRLEGFVMYSCANTVSSLCVFGQASPGKSELVVISFDPLGGGSRQELLRIPLEPGSSAAVGGEYSWHLSPDGSRIAIAKRHDNQIRLVPLNEGQTRLVTIQGYTGIQELYWANDSQSMFLSLQEPGGAVLLHVDLNGDAQSIWQQPQSNWTWGFPSPDGRHLAISAESVEANVWMISDF